MHERSDDPRIADKRAVRAAFNRAAGSYDSAAAVQRDICAALLRFAAPHLPRNTIARVLDAGCGTGHALALLAQRFPDAALIALDFAPAMLARLECPPTHPPALALCADLEALPLADASIDVAWSSLALQWCEPRVALAELARVLRPGAVAWIATLGPATLHELRAAFATVDDADHVIGFHPAAHWLASAVHAGLVVQAHQRRPLYALGADLRSLLRDIKAIGAHSVGATRRRAPFGKAAWRALEAHYEQHRRSDAMLPATYDVILMAVARPE
jgi:malonyl-CoA O-methyltransferase